MESFVKITPDGRFSLDGKRWMCNSVIYYGRFPGSCGPDWMTDAYWPKNEAEFDRDFNNMARVGINHAAMFFHMDAFFENGSVLQKGLDRMDRIVGAAKSAGVRITIFIGPFIDSPAAYKQVTGQEWEDDNRFLPSFNPNLHQAYVLQMAPFAERYRNEPTVAAYTDRIDRFHKGFDNVTIPFNLKDEWAQHLRDSYRTFDELMTAVGGSLENNPKDWDEVLIPQESKWNGSLKNPLAYDYILWQKKSIGDAQAAFDAAINAIAPNQFVWTPFEGNTNTWAMLDGFSPERKKLQAIWMEYYFFEMTRASFVQPFEEWPHTREVIHRRLAHELPVIYTTAYQMARFLKLAVEQPVVICHGGWVGNPAYGVETLEQQAAIIDRVNCACLAADADGWHYWNWRDDNASWMSHVEKRRYDPVASYFGGESLGLNDFDGFPRPALSLVTRYSREASRRAEQDRAPKKSDVLVLSSAPRMYNLFRRMALPTASAVVGAFSRLGCEPDVRWSAQNDIRITQETLDDYRMIAIADNMYERDFADMPDKLLLYVEKGGTLYLTLGSTFESFQDEHGNPFACPAYAKLAGVDTTRPQDWPGAGSRMITWPYPTDASQEPNMDVQAFPRLLWGVTPEFRPFVTYPDRMQLLGFRSTDDDMFLPLPALVEGAEVIAVAKFPAGTLPFVYRHKLGRGTVYVNAWTNNLFRDSESRVDYGGWDYDWILDLPLATSNARDVDLTKGAAIWLRNSWGYFWKQM